MRILRLLRSEMCAAMMLVLVAMPTLAIGTNQDELINQPDPPIACLAPEGRCGALP